MANNEVIERFPARVLTDTRDVPMLQAGSVDIDLSNKEKVLDIIRQHATDATIFDTRTPFVWAALISNNRRDYYSTIMDPATTLRNYVEDAISGVAFMDSHDTFQQPAGRSFAGAMTEENGVVNVYAAFYTIPDLKNQRINTTDLIDSIRSGITKDVSVGFKRGDNFEMRCTICGGDMQRWDECVHFQGVRYETYDESTGEFVDRVAMGIIIDARLSEVSGVYDGATPTCMIEKAKDLAQRGMLQKKQRETLERQYRMVLPARSATYAVAGNDEVSTLTERTLKDKENDDLQGDRTMADDKETLGIFKAQLEGFERSMRAVGVIDEKEKDLPVDLVARRAETEITRLRTIETQFTEFVKAEVDDALAQGVRAQGDKFDKERFDSLFKRASLLEIRSFRKEWQDKADAELAGGRRSTESTDDKETNGDNDGDDDANANRTVDESDFYPESVYAMR